MANSFLESRFSEDNQTTFSILSSTEGSTAATSYFEVVQILISLGVIYSIKKIKYRRSHILVKTLIFVSNLMIVAKFFGDQQSPLIQVQFLYTIAFSFGIRLTSVFFVSIVTMIASVAFLQIRLSVIAKSADPSSSLF